MAIGKWIEGLARAVAILGGIALTAIAIISTLSIFGRAMLQFGLRPIPGDFELVEAGTAFAIAAFMPWCHLKRGHADVGILMDNLGKRTTLVIDLVADFLLVCTAILLTWRLFAGLADKQAYGETTFILQFPLWWAYAGCLFGLFAWIVVGLWTILADIEAIRAGRRRNADAGALH